MSKDLKDFIDKAENEDKSHAELDITINNLELEVTHLKTIIEEQDRLIKTLGAGSNESVDAVDDAWVCKKR